MTLQTTDTPVRGNVVSDLSQRVIQLARMIDHLPPGHYIIDLEKPDLIAASWKTEIERLELVNKVAITNYTPE